MHFSGSRLCASARGPVMAPVGHTCTQRWQPVQLAGDDAVHDEVAADRRPAALLARCARGTRRGSTCSDESTGLGAVCPRPQRELALTTRASRSSRSRSASSPLPVQIASRISTRCPVPTRQGTHLPHDSSCVKLQEVPGDVDHAGVVVEHDHAAGAHDRAGRGEALVVDRRVEELVAEAAAGGSAGLHRLELAAWQHAAADVVDHAGAAWCPWAPRPGRRAPHLADEAKILVPLRASRCRCAAYQSAPWSMIAGQRWRRSRRC